MSDPPRRSYQSQPLAHSTELRALVRRLKDCVPSQLEADLDSRFRNWEALERQVESDRARRVLARVGGPESSQVDDVYDIYSEFFAADRALLIQWLTDQSTWLENRFGSPLIERWRERQRLNLAGVLPQTRKEHKLARAYSDRLDRARVRVGRHGEGSVSLSEVEEYTRAPDEAVHQAGLIVRAAWLNEQHLELSGIYENLLRVRQHRAQSLGIANSRELSALEYGRDYDRSEANEFRSASLQQLVPVALEWSERAHRIGRRLPSPLWGFGSGRVNLPHEESPALLVDSVATSLAPRLPEVADTLRMLFESGAVDSRPKARGSFTTFLPDASQPVLVLPGLGGVDSIAPLVHELGHAFAWQQGVRRSDNLPFRDWQPRPEVAELQAIALEWLALPELEAHWGDEVAAELRRQQIERSLSTILTAVLIDDFEERAALHPGADAETLVEHWRAVARPLFDWRGETPATLLDRDSLWLLWAPLFRYPHYTLSYALAHVVGLELAELNARDSAEASVRYLELSQMSGLEPFREVVGRIGLSDPFERGTLVGVRERCRKAIERSL